MKRIIYDAVHTVVFTLAGGFFFLAAMAAALGVGWAYTLLYASLSGLMFMLSQLMGKKERE